jgi:hypothetical protein
MAASYVVEKRAPGMAFMPDTDAPTGPDGGLICGEFPELNLLCVYVVYVYIICYPLCIT